MTRNSVNPRFRWPAAYTRLRFEALEARLAPAITPIAGYEFVPLGEDLLFYGDFTQQANGTSIDYILTSTTALIGYAPPAGFTAEEAFEPVYTYTGALQFNSAGDPLIFQGCGPKPSSIEGLYFLMQSGELQTQPFTSENGTTFDARTVWQGACQYVGVNNFVNDGMSLSAPKTINLSKYLHVKVESVSFGPPPEVVNGVIEYEPSVELRGAIIVGNPDGNNITLSVDGSSYILVSADGWSITGFEASASGKFEVAGVEFAGTFGGGYFPASGEVPPQLVFFGKVSAKFGGEDSKGGSAELEAVLGTSQTPGLVFDLGTDPKLEKFKFGASGSGDFDGIQIEVNAVGFEYSEAEDSFGVSGGFGIQLTKQIGFDVQLGDKNTIGLTVADGTWQLNNLTIAAENIKLPGGWGFKTIAFQFSYDESNGDYSVAGDVDLRIPGGIEVGGGIRITDGQLTDVRVDYDVVEGEGFLRIPGTGLSISSIHGNLNNLNNLSDLSLDVAVSVAYGPTFSLEGDSAQIFRANASGSFSSQGISLSGSVYVGAVMLTQSPKPNQQQNDNPSPEQSLKLLPTFKGVIGSGYADLVVDLASSSASFNAGASLIDGVIQANFVFTCNSNGDVYATGTAGAYVPKRVPIIGGDQLASAGFTFQWDGSQSAGYVAAYTEILDQELGIKYTFNNYNGGSNGFSLIGSPLFSGLFSGTTTYTLSINPATLLNGTTSTMFTANWGDPGASVTVSLTPPGGQEIQQANFAANGIQIDNFYSTASQLVFSIVGSSTNAYAEIANGSYTLKIVSSVKFSSPPTLSTNPTIARPTINFEGPWNAAQNPNSQANPVRVNNGIASVSMSGQVGAALANGTKVSVYADDDSSGHDGVLVGTANYSAGAFTVPINMAGLLPERYYLYATIDDGLNSPQTSAYSAAVLSTSPVYGSVLDPNRNAGIPGLFLWIDVNGNGAFDAPVIDPTTGEVTSYTDAFTLSNELGSYSIPRPTQGITLQNNKAYTLYVYLPDGFTPGINPATGQPYTVESRVNEATRIVFPFTYTGSNEININVIQGPTISGFVYSDLNNNGQQDSNEPGLQGVQVYLDLNNNGALDPDEPSGITYPNGQYRILPVDQATAYTVRLNLSPIQHAQGATSATVTTSSSAIISAGPTFRVLRYSTISGTITGYALSGNSLGTTATSRSGWTVKLINSSGSVVQTTTTNSQGYYEFQPVAPGQNYTVEEVPPGGWRQLTPPGVAPSFAFQPVYRLVTGSSTNYLQVRSVAAGDFNQDGLTDFVAVNANDTQLYTYFSQSSSSGPYFGYSTLSVHPSGSSTKNNLFKVIVCNFFGDGTPTIVAIDRSNYIYIIKNTGYESFTQLYRINFTDVPSGSEVIDMVAADFDGDGSDDIAFITNTVGTVQNDPYVIIQTAAKIKATSPNKDGEMSFNNSNVYFSRKLPDNLAGGLAAGYTNGAGDKYADLLVNGVYTDSGSSANYPFTIQGGTSATAYFTGGTTAFTPGSAAFGFFDGDQYLDNVFGHPGGSPSFGVYVDDGNTAPSGLGVLGGFSTVYWLPMLGADVNGDQLGDLTYAPTAYSPTKFGINGSPSVASVLYVYLNQLGRGYNPRAQPFDSSAAYDFDLSTFAGGTAPVQVSNIIGGLFRGYTSFLGTNSPFSGDQYVDLVITMFNSNAFVIAWNATNPNINSLVVYASPTRDVRNVNFVNGQIRPNPTVQSARSAAAVATLAEPANNVVGGIVFDDTNRDGTMQPGEPRRAGVGVYLDLNRNGRFDDGEPVTATNEWGAYAFGGLPDGNHVARLLLPGGHGVTSPGGDAFEFTLVGGLGGGDADFGLAPMRDVVLTADAAGTEWSIVRDGKFLRVVNNTTNTVELVERLEAVRSLRFVGGAGTDRVKLDFGAGGRISLPGGIRFDGQAGDEFTFTDLDIPNLIELTNSQVTINGLGVTLNGVGRVTLDTGIGDDTIRAHGPAMEVGTVRGTGDRLSLLGFDFHIDFTGVNRLELVDTAAGSMVRVAPIAGLDVYQTGGGRLLIDFAGLTGTNRTAGNWSFDNAGSLNVNPMMAYNSVPSLLTGAGAGGGPQVNVYDAAGELKRSFFAFEENFNGGVRVATGDLNADGVEDWVVAAGSGGGPRVIAYDGRTGKVMFDFFAYDIHFTGGVWIAVGDVTGDGHADIITGAGAGGGPHVKVFGGRDGREIPSFSFFAYDRAFTGGVTVAVGDVNGDGMMDIITGAGAGGGPHVRAVDPRTMAELASFLAFGADFQEGVTVTAGDINGDGTAEILAGMGGGTSPLVRVYRQSRLDGEFFADALTAIGGVMLATKDVDGDGRAEFFTAPGRGRAPIASAWRWSDRFERLRDVTVYDPAFLGGVFVG